MFGLKCTSPNEPGSSLPSLLGTSTSVSKVRGRGIDGLGGARHRAGELLPGKLLQRDDGIHADLDGRRVGLRNGDVDAQRIDPRDVEELFARPLPASGIDQRAGIDVALGEHAVERARRRA